MAQHFLLSAAARSLSLAKVARMSDEEAEEAFKCIRWSIVLPEMWLRLHLQIFRAQDFQMPNLRRPILSHVRNDICQPQASGAGLPVGNRDLCEWRERTQRASTEPRS
jgi:hypothetical protein